MNLEKVLQYHVWADDTVREIVRELDDEEFTREVGPPFGSIKNVCVHIVVALEYNLQVAEQVNIDGETLYETVDNLSKDELLKRWEKADQDLVKAAQKARKCITFPNFVSGGTVDLEVEDFFFQYVMHTVYHRGQIMTLLKVLGKEGVTTDYIVYILTKGIDSN